MFATRSSAVALFVMTLSMSACEFFSTKPFAPAPDLSYVEVPDALAKYAPGLPPTMYARARALGVSLSTGSVAGDALAGLRMSAAPFSPLAVDLASVTPVVWVPELGTGLQYIDDDTTPQALPFAFSFYGQSYSSVFVSANGHISFGNPIPFKRSALERAKQALPIAILTKQVVCWMSGCVTAVRLHSRRAPVSPGRGRCPGPARAARGSG